MNKTPGITAELNRTIADQARKSGIDASSPEGFLDAAVALKRISPEAFAHPSDGLVAALVEAAS